MEVLRRRTGWNCTNCASSGPVVITFGWRCWKMDNDLRSGSRALSRAAEGRAYGFLHCLVFGIGVHGHSTHAFFFPMDSIGRTSFLFLAAQEKKRSNTLKGTGEKKAPPNRPSLKYRAGHCSPRNSLRCATLKQALRTTPPALYFALRAPTSSNGRGAEWDFDVGTQACDLRCGDFEYRQARGVMRMVPDAVSSQCGSSRPDVIPIV